MKYDRYQKFRQQTYQMLGKAKDSTFELIDLLGNKTSVETGVSSFSPIYAASK